MSKPLKVTINYAEGTEVITQRWPLVPSPNLKEHNRVSVESHGLSYSVVLDPYKPRVEVWNIDGNGELKDIVAHFALPAFNLPPAKA